MAAPYRRYSTFRICVLRTLNKIYDRTSVQYFCLIFEAYRTYVPYFGTVPAVTAYRTRLLYFSPIIEAHRTYVTYLVFLRTVPSINLVKQRSINDIKSVC